MKIFLIVLLVIAIIFVGPWLTWLSLHEILTDNTFDLGGWLAAFWLMFVFGGTGAAISSR